MKEVALLDPFPRGPARALEIPGLRSSGVYSDPWPPQLLRYLYYYSRAILRLPLLPSYHEAHDEAARTTKRARRSVLARTHRLLSYSVRPLRRECRRVVLVIVIAGASLCDTTPPSIVALPPTASNVTRHHSPRRLVPSLLMLMMSTHSHSSRRSSPKRC
jgi:hypothetical protein